MVRRLCVVSQITSTIAFKNYLKAYPFGIYLKTFSKVELYSTSDVDYFFSECKEALDQSFGRLDIRYTNKFDPYCNWLIENGGMAEKFAVLSIHQVYFGHNR